MVVIRLARVGRNKYAIYRIVAADKRRAATGKFLAILGQYNPHTKEIHLDTEQIQKYLSNGAQASDRVLRLLQANGVDVPKWAATHDRFKKSKQEAVETPEKAEATPEKAPEDAPAETAASEEATPEPEVAQAAEAAEEAAEPKAASVDAVETAASEEGVAKDSKESTEAVAEAAEAATKEAAQDEAAK